MGKKVGSVFISIFLTIVIGVLSIFIGIRMFLEPKSMTVFVTSMMEEEGFWEEVEIENVDFREFMSEDEFKEELGEFVSDYVKYSLGVEGAEKPSIKEIRVLLEEYVHDYAEEHNIEVDYDEFNQYLDEMEEELEEDLAFEETNLDEDVQIVLNFFFSDMIVYALIGVILFLIGLDLLIIKDFIVVSLHVGIPLIINGVASFGLGFFFGSFTTSGGEEVGIFDSLVNVANRLGLYYLLPGILLIVIFIVFKNKIKKDDNINNNMNNNYNNGYNNYNNGYNYNNNYNNGYNNNYNTNYNNNNFNNYNN